MITMLYYKMVHSLSTTNLFGKVYVVLPTLLCPVHWYSPLSFSVKTKSIVQYELPERDVIFGPVNCN